MNEPPSSPSPESISVPQHAGPTVAVVDIGSNSIKSLVARRDAEGHLAIVEQQTIDARIGTGITGTPPRLGVDAMYEAIGAIRELLAAAETHAPTTVRIVATSAVRDAANRDDFIMRLREATSRTLDVLSGEEEARLIGRGIACDPALRGVPAFYLFDLGGGSLEMLAVRGGKVEQLCSLKLGCVRVTELCVVDPGEPFDPDEIARIRSHARTVVADSRFRFNLRAPAPAVVTGGTATTFRAMHAVAAGLTFEASNPELSVEEMHDLGMRLAGMSVYERRRLPGMPPRRADVFPAALITLAELAWLAGVDTFCHSLYNLRFGIADELLPKA